MSETRPGRPSKYDPKYCEELIKHQTKGYSFETFGPSINVATSTIYLWLKHKEFSEAKKIATDKCRLFWERLGVGGATGKVPGFNVSAWIFNMKNRFHWRDRVETTGHIEVKPYIIQRRDGSEVELGVRHDDKDTAE